MSFYKYIDKNITFFMVKDLIKISPAILESIIMIRKNIRIYYREY